MIWPVKALLASLETVLVRKKNLVGKGTDCKSRQAFGKLQYLINDIIIRDNLNLLGKVHTLAYL